MKLIKQIFLLYNEPFINQAYSVKMAGCANSQIKFGHKWDLELVEFEGFHNDLVQFQRLLVKIYSVVFWWV